MTTGNSGSQMIDTIEASGDLSSNQFLLHAINTSGQLAIAATRGQRVHGVLLNDPAASGRAARVCFSGLCRVTAGGTFQEGVELTTNASGQAIEASELTDIVCGTAKASGTSGEDTTMYVGVAGGYISSPGIQINEDFSGYAATDLLPQRAVDGTTGTGTAGDLNIIQTLNGTKLGLWVIGTQTIITPGGVAGGVNVGYDQTDNDGIELFSNVYPASGAPLVVSTTPAFQFTLAVNFALADGTDMLFCGFRKEEVAYQGAMTGYGTYFGLGSTTEASPMALYVREELNGAAGAETDTGDTQADATTLWIRTKVSAAGVATIEHADTKAALAAPSTTSAFTFDTGDILVPTFRFLQANAAQTGAVKLIHWEVGPQ